MGHDPVSMPRVNTTQAIKDLILARNLHPGDPMPSEAELVTLLGVSRSSLRESVRTLVALDILEVRHGTGTFVGQMSMRPFVEAMAFRGQLLPGDDFEALRQVIEVRTALDLALAASIVEQLAGGDPDDLYQLCGVMERAAQRGENFMEADRAFHLGLANRLGNESTESWCRLLGRARSHRAPPRMPTPRDIQDTAVAYRSMLDAAVAGDLESYLAAVGPLCAAHAGA